MLRRRIFGQLFASLALNMWGSKFLASLIAEEATTYPLIIPDSGDEVLLTFQCRNSQMLHQPHGWKHPLAQGLLSEVGGPSNHRAREGASKIGDQLFDGQAKPVVAHLKDSAQDFSLQ